MMISEPSPQDRVQIMDTPVALPAKCAICGYPGGDDRRFIDIGLTVDYYGAVIFCTSCIVDIANKLNYFSPEQYYSMADCIAKLRDDNTRLATESVGLKNALASWASNLSGTDVDHGDGSRIELDSPTAKESGVSDSKPGGLPPGESEADTDPLESLLVERPPHLLSPAKPSKPGSSKR